MKNKRWVPYLWVNRNKCYISGSKIDRYVQCCELQKNLGLTVYYKIEITMNTAIDYLPNYKI